MYCERILKEETNNYYKETFLFLLKIVSTRN